MSYNHPQEQAASAETGMTLVELHKDQLDKLISEYMETYTRIDQALCRLNGLEATVSTIKNSKEPPERDVTAFDKLGSRVVMLGKIASDYRVLASRLERVV